MRQAELCKRLLRLAEVEGRRRAMRRAVAWLAKVDALLASLDSDEGKAEARPPWERPADWWREGRNGMTTPHPRGTG